MYKILCILVIIVSSSLFFFKGYKRFAILIIGLTFLPYGIALSPHFNAQRLMVLSFFLSVLLRPSEWKNIKSTPCFLLLLLLFISFIVTAMNDKRVGVLDGTYKAIIAFLESFGCIFIGYLSIKSDRNLYKVFNLIRKLSYVVCVYSLICFLLGHDVYNQLMPDSDSMLNGGRLRIASFFYNSHVAGFAISIMALMLLYQDLMKKKMPFKDPVIYLLFIALFLTGSRSSLLDFLFGSVVLFIPNFIGSKHKVRFLLVAITLIGISYFVVGDYIMSTFSDIFKEGGGDTGGSSLEMRQQQLYYSLFLFHQNPIFGNGINYFWEVIKVQDRYLSSMLLGAESYIFILLIDRGLIQIILNIIYFSTFYIYLVRLKSQNKFLALAILTAFLINSVSEGNLYKWIYALPFIGILLYKSKTDNIKKA